MNPATRRAEAGRVSRDVAERLRDPDRVRRLTVEATGDGEVERSVWRDLSLSAGYPGLALLFAELSAWDPSWTAALHAQLRLAVPAANRSREDGVFAGHGALAVAVRAAARATGGYRDAHASLTAAVVAQLSRRTAADIPAAELAFVDYDAVSGVAGLFAHLATADTDPAVIEPAVTWLARLCLRDGDRPGWWVDHGPNPHVAPPPGGHGNLGVSHGAAGILAALARAADVGVCPPESLAAADRLGDWLLEQSRTDRHGPWWPMVVTAAAEDESPRRTEPSWCYGAPGIATALRAAGRWRDRPDWIEAARAGLDSASLAPIALPDAGLCHGWSGLAHTLWRFDSRAYARTIDEAIDRVIAAHDADAPFGFRCQGGEASIDHPGFLEGAAGTALALHRYATGEPSKVDWDAVLLL